MWFICTGLVLDIVGVILIYVFGLPPRRYPQIGTTIVYPGGEDASSRAKKKRIQRYFVLLSHTGISLLVVGFLLQIIGTIATNLDMIETIRALMMN